VGIEERLAKKFKTIPKWAEDFSVEIEEDAKIARRDFIRFLFLVSAGLFTGTVGVLIRSIFRKKKKVVESKPVKIMEEEDIGIGDSYVFEIPETKEPAILVRLARDHYVAYSQKCTHLQCPVLWKKEETKLFCPCHKGAFSIETGEVLYGPPERPLPQVKLAVKKDGIYYVGMEALA